MFGTRAFVPVNHYPVSFITARTSRQRIDMCPCFCKYGNMTAVQSRKNTERVTKYADMFSAMGTEARLRIMQLLLSAHPEGLVVGEIQEELEIPNSTLAKLVAARYDCGLPPS